MPVENTPGKRPVRVRIAPSPTGDPHVGTGYIGLFNYAFAKSQKPADGGPGKFILRIEDTDQVRSTRESEQAILDSLKWLGITWDEGPDIGGPHAPYRQSERTERYQARAAELVAKGAAYPCFCSKDRLDALRRGQMRTGQRLGYDGHCRKLDPDEAARRIAAGEPHTIRMKVPADGATIIDDLLRGKVRVENSEVDDQILLKADGFPTYHLANVVDDHDMEITHVIRGEEWLISTPKHLILYSHFGWEPPTFAHLPLLRNPDRTKLSKRRNPVSINYYRRAGFLPQALLNYLGMMGWTMPTTPNPEDPNGPEIPGAEMFTLEEMVANFDLTRVSLGGPIFDLAKLSWLNGKYLRERSTPHDWLAYLKTHLYTDAKLLEAIPLAQERVEKFDDFHDYVAFIFNGALTYRPAELIPAKRTPGETAAMLKAVVEAYDKLYDWHAETAMNVLKGMVEAGTYTSKELFMAVRVVVTGSSASPPLDQCLAVVGRDMVRHRLRDAIRQLEAEEARLTQLYLPGADTKKKRATGAESLTPKVDAIVAKLAGLKSLKASEVPALIEQLSHEARIPEADLRRLLYVALNGTEPPPTLEEQLGRAGKDKAIQSLDKIKTILRAIDTKDDE